MRPSAKSFVCGEGWSYSASQRFASLVNGYSLLVEVYSMVHGVLYVDVFRYSRCSELVNIRDVLIEECFAEPAEESYESKVCIESAASALCTLIYFSSHCLKSQEVELKS